MHSLTWDYPAKLRFDTQQLATLRALGEYGGKQRLYVAQSPEVLSDLRQIAVIESTESSNLLRIGDSWAIERGRYSRRGPMNQSLLSTTASKSRGMEKARAIAQPNREDDNA
jgi:hypothetical protein